MKTLALLAILLPVAGTAQAPDSFAKWWPGFQAAVARKDGEAVGKGAKFPMGWELGKIRQLKSSADLIGHFDVYFPAEIRKAVATGKPVSLPNGIYSITWKARGDEYSMYFEFSGGTFVLQALSEGPG